MRFVQHNDPIILVPQHISKIGCYTSNVILLVSFHGFLDKYYVLGTMLLCLYVTTYLHWKQVRYKSLIKTLDIIICISTITRITAYDSYRWSQHRVIWKNHLMFSLSVFTVNEILFYYLVRNKNSIIYSLPNTTHRETIYYINVLCHTLCLHVFLCITASYLAICSQYQ